MSQSAGKQIRDLKTTGHLMLLESGVYCVFLEPGSVPPTPETGLPGVQISAGPGPDKEAVSVLSYHQDGWVGADSAALVRIAGPAAHVLVTVYQEPNSRHEAPKLQVMRVVERVPGPAGAAGAAPLPPGGPKAARAVEILAHIYGRGDVGGMLGEAVGEAGSTRWVEGFAVAPRQDIPVADLEYQAVLGRGWMSPWSEGGQFCGSRGMSLPILGMRVRLRGASAQAYRTVLTASFVDGSKAGPVGDDEVAEAASLSPLESFQLDFVPKQAGAAPKPRAAQPKAAQPAAAKPKATRAKAVAPEPAPPAAAKRGKPAAKPVAKPAPRRR